MSASSLISHMNDAGGASNSAAASMAFEEWVDENAANIFWSTSDCKMIFEYFRNDAVMSQCVDYLVDKITEVPTFSYTCVAVAAILSNTKNESLNSTVVEKMAPYIRDKGNKKVILDCFSNRAVQMQVEDYF